MRDEQTDVKLLLKFVLRGLLFALPIPPVLLSDRDIRAEIAAGRVALDPFAVYARDHFRSPLAAAAIGSAFGMPRRTDWRDAPPAAGAPKS